MCSLLISAELHQTFTNTCDIRQFSLLLGDRSYVLVYRNTCGVTTVLCTAKLEHNYFSPVAWDLRCAVSAGIHRENPEDKSKEAEFI